MWRVVQPLPGSSVWGCGLGSPSALPLLMSQVPWHGGRGLLGPRGLDLVLMLPEDPAPFLILYR